MRIWCFGCSFTDYFYPTWADLLIHEANLKGHSGENWGAMGRGNLYIYLKIQECHARNNLGADDWVFVCWSNFYREDAYTHRLGWHTPHSVFRQTEYRDGTVNGFGSSEYYMMRDLALIQGTQLSLQALGVNQLHWSILPIHDQGNISKTYSNVMFNAPDMMTDLDLVIQDDAKKATRIKTYPPGETNNVLEEWHPLPAEHRDFLERHVAKQISWLNNISEKTHQLADHWHKKLETLSQPVDLNKTGWCKRRLKEW
jgi:hypothetical protein